MVRASGHRALYSLIWGARVLVVVLAVSVAIVLDNGASESHRAEARQQWQARINDLSLKLQSTILQNVQTVWGLAATVSVNPQITEKEFQQLASVIFGLAPQLRNIGLAPDLTIRNIYPIQGNEAALGFDLTKTSLSTAQIQYLQTSGQALFSGPINLVQGGQGMAARIPIFESESGRFWGVVSVILDLNRLYQAVELTSFEDQGHLAISTGDDPEIKAGFFFGDADTDWQEPVSAQASMPGINWTLFAQPSQGWPNHPESPWLLRSLLGLMVLIITSGAFWLTNLLLRDHQMQRRFRGLFELAPFGIGLFEAHTGKLLRANSSFEALFGRQADGLSFFEEVYDQTGKALPSGLDIRGRLKKNPRFSALEVFFRGADGQLIPILLHGLGLKDYQNERVIWLVTEDITEQKKADRIKSEFISTVSHELRTPLTSIAGSLGLLSNNAVGELPPKASNLANIAYRNTRQLTFLINDLLDIEKLAAGKVIFQTDRYRLIDLVSECVEGVESFAVEKKVTLSITELHDATVDVDRARLDQALSNLLSNAIKFSPDESEVLIYTEISGERVRICVCDKGPGVPMDFRDRIFQKFSQADSSDRRSKGGTGLGLAITRELMHAMGGSVDFESEEGRGACFWLELPLARPDGESPSD